MMIIEFLKGPIHTLNVRCSLFSHMQQIALLIALDLPIGNASVQGYTNYQLSNKIDYLSNKNCMK